MAQLPPMDLYGALLFQVVGQQLSVAATRRILARIQALFGGHLPSPAELLAEDPGKIREAGLSWRKISTLRDLAGRMTDGRLDQEALSATSAGYRTIGTHGMETGALATAYAEALSPAWSKQSDRV